MVSDAYIDVLDRMSELSVNREVVIQLAKIKEALYDINKTLKNLEVSQRV